MKSQTEKLPQHYFFVQKPGKLFEKRFDAKYRKIKAHAWYMYDLVLLENNREVARMKQKMVNFEDIVQSKLDEYDQKLEQRVERRLEEIQRAFLRRTERAAHDMFEEKNKIIMQAIDDVKDTCVQMRQDHQVQTKNFE